MAITTVAVSFTGAEDSVTPTFADQGGTSYRVGIGVESSDVVAVTVNTKTATSLVVTPSARFTGTVNLVLY